MDRIDRRLLRLLQRQSDRPIADIAAEIGLSPSACHRRIRLLEARGVIRGYAARLDPQALGLAVQAFVEISLTSQSVATLDAFESAVRRHEDILECHLTSGSADYLLRVIARSMEDYDRIHRHVLARLPGVASMQTIFALRAIQPFRGYPVTD